MRQREIHRFLKRFFEAAECEVLREDEDVLTVQLTVEMDKALMNRPFYWHYIEKTGGIPNPKTLTLLTNFDAVSDIKGERIHFGSFRLHQIFQLTKTFGGSIRMFENRPGTNKSHTPLVPWLCLNAKISYICDRKRDDFRSIGLNLMNGRTVENFHFRLTDTCDLTAKIPDFAFTFTPLIKPVSGMKRIERYLLHHLEQEDLSWAEQARNRWEKDLRLLDVFYEDVEEKPETYFIERDALQKQYEPRITIEMINGGMFYLTGERFG